MMEITHSTRQSKLTAVLRWRSDLFHIQFVASRAASKSLRVGADQIRFTSPEAT